MHFIEQNVSDNSNSLTHHLTTIAQQQLRRRSSVWGAKRI